MRFRVFNTAIGWFALGWTDTGISRVILPGAEPDWLRAAPPPMPAKRRPVAATSLGGAKVIAGGDGDAEAAMLFGTRLHLLLEHLPGRDAADWPAIARDVLTDAEGGLPEPAALVGLDRKSVV